MKNASIQATVLCSLCILGGAPAVVNGQPTSDEAEVVGEPNPAADFMARWSIRKASEPPTTEDIATKTDRLFASARGLRISESVSENGVLQYRIVSHMASAALRTEVYQPDDTVYTVFSWYEGEVFEYRPALTAPRGAPLKDVITRYRGTDVPEVQQSMVVPPEEACKFGIMCVSWVASGVDERFCDAVARHIREGAVVGEAEIGDSGCWVVRREGSAMDEDGVMTFEHLEFIEKDSGRPVQWVTTQATEASRIERVRRFEEIEILTDPPEVDWRLGDCVSGKLRRTNAKGEQE